MKKASYKDIHDYYLMSHYYDGNFKKPKRPAKKRPRKGIEEIMSSVALVRPGDITEAADSTDLLEQLKVANSLRVEDTLDARTRTEMRKKRESEIFNKYKGKATEYYEGMWDRCGESAVGHNFINLDTGGGTIRVCETCSFPKGAVVKRGYGYQDGDTQSAANEYKDELFRNLTKQLMSLDEKAGLLEQPKDEDFIGLERKYGRKKRWWQN